VSAFEMISAGRKMLLPVDAAKISDFDDKHHMPQDMIKDMHIDLDLMNKIIRENILQNQNEMKSAFDGKVTPYPHCVVGSIVLLNDPVEKVGVLGNLHRHCVGLFPIM